MTTDADQGLPHRPWASLPQDQSASDERFPVAIDTLRRLLDTITAAAPPDEVWGDVAAQLDEMSALLTPYAVPERQQVVGRRTDLPGRGQVMSPVFIVDDWDTDSVTGRVTFGRFYLGGNGAVHGGAIPLLFDDVLGRLANTHRTRARTAYLHVDYRAITPIERELQVTARVTREEGRKRYATCQVHDGDVLVAEAEGLFVALKPGQP